MQASADIREGAGNLDQFQGFSEQYHGESQQHYAYNNYNMYNNYNPNFSQYNPHQLPYHQSSHQGAVGSEVYDGTTYFYGADNQQYNGYQGGASRHSANAQIPNNYSGARPKVPRNNYKESGRGERNGRGSNHRRGGGDHKADRRQPLQECNNSSQFDDRKTNHRNDRHNRYRGSGKEFSRVNDERRSYVEPDSEKQTRESNDDSIHKDNSNPTETEKQTNNRRNRRGKTNHKDYYRNEQHYDNRRTRYNPENSAPYERLNVFGERQLDDVEDSESRRGKRNSYFSRGSSNQRGTGRGNKYRNDRNFERSHNRNNHEEDYENAPEADKDKSTVVSRDKRVRGKNTFIIAKREAKNTLDQKDHMTELLTKGTYECMVCYDRIRQTQAIWSCKTCFNCYHIGCIKKWISSSKTEEDNSWRCPACNNESLTRSLSYYCFCGKMKDPKTTMHDTPHSCGELCSRKRGNEWCTHNCNVLCHPGPCPPCTAFIKRPCGCGKTSRDVKCSVTEALSCGEACGKTLSCGVHQCTNVCHEGDCVECEEMVEQVCYCGKENRTLPCDEENGKVKDFACKGSCEKLLDCGHHKCQSKCHDGPCEDCQLTVDKVSHCPCGKRPLESLRNKEVREKCQDAIPTCGDVCGKTLKCGKPGSFHTCESLCHEGKCPPCPLQTPVRCRCGNMSQNMACIKLTTKSDEVLCIKQCRKFRFCGKHKCGKKCCIEVDHPCPVKCNKMLSCGNHRCRDACHRGNCGRCWETSYNELTCYCGATIMFPPIPCGTEPPPCDNLCTRVQRCDHTVTHVCHPKPDCPPCTYLMEAKCYGGHKMMKSTPCHIGAISCGQLCDKDLPCGFHKCNKVCHDGACVAMVTNNKGKNPAPKCPQKCSKLRQCGHPCGNPCHKGKCPSNNCKNKVTVQCKCGLRSIDMPCADNEREYCSIATVKLATQMQHVGTTGGSIDLTHILNTTSSKENKEKFKRLDCNEACAQRERNKRMALALQIENPDSRSSLGTSSSPASYSDTMKEMAKKDLHFVTSVHDALHSLVMNAKSSKQKAQSHWFQAMKRDKRQFIHEYSKLFGCTTQSYDEEPRKNVVAVAQKGMCLLPVFTIMDVILRENGQKKAPTPVWGPSLRNEAINCKDGASGGGLGLQKLEKRGSHDRESSADTNSSASNSAASKPVIDYFNFQG